MLPSLRLGQTDVELRPIGVGTWQWGDSKLWKFDPKLGPSRAKEAFHASLDAGVTFFDTAEIYGKGKSERILGALLDLSGREAFVATKFAPLPFRLTSTTMTKALERSLERLRIERVDLYQVHWPWTVLSKSSLMERLVDAVDEGKTRFVGVSNYGAQQMIAAHRELASRGVPLVSNQVHYSLLNRDPESNGVLETCRGLGVTLIAYSPLEQGVLGGRYRPGGQMPPGLRRLRGVFRHLAKAMPVVDELQAIGTVHGRTPSQVALNWLARQPGVLPIPGAKDGRQAGENARAIEFSLDDDDVERLNAVSARYARR